MEVCGYVGGLVVVEMDVVWYLCVCGEWCVV